LACALGQASLAHSSGPFSFHACRSFLDLWSSCTFFRQYPVPL